MQIFDDSTTTQIEKVLAHTSRASAASLPLAGMSQGMLNSHQFAQMSMPLHGLLALMSLDEQRFIGTHTASFDAGGASLPR